MQSMRLDFALIRDHTSRPSLAMVAGEKTRKTKRETMKRSGTFIIEMSTTACGLTSQYDGNGVRSRGGGMV